MSIEEQMEAINILRNDVDYYGKYGQSFISNSNIKTLLENPLGYGQSVDKTVPMLRGSYVHQYLLQPEREEPLIISQEGSRNSKAYKDAAAGDILLLQKEVDEINPILERVCKNDLFMDLIRGSREPNTIEEPMVGQINGVWFKGKADKINKERGVLVDIKTTTDGTKFKSSFYRYGYDTQAYIYQELFDMPVIFLVIDMTTGALQYVSVTQETLDAAKIKVLRALDTLELYYGEEKEDINQLVEYNFY